MEVIQCQAWDLLGDHYEKVDATHEIRLAGGRAAYHFAANTSNERVRLERFDSYNGKLIRRYVRPEQPVELVPIKENSE